MAETAAEVTSEQYLPPKDYWNFEPGEKIETPIDERGLVIVPDLITAVISSIHPAYNWRNTVNIHHLYYEARSYPYTRESRVNPRFFRELPTSKILVPKDFHALLHERLLLPPVPDEEVMALQIESWKMAARLFSNMKGVIATEKQTRRRRDFIRQNGKFILSKTSPDKLEDRVGEEYLASQFEAYFAGHERHYQSATTIPEEYWLFNPDDPFETIAADLGRVVIPKALSYRHAVLA